MAVHAPITGARLRAPVYSAPLPRSEPFTTRSARKRIESQIEALIALLDELDGDPDLEDSDFDQCLAGDDAPRSLTLDPHGRVIRWAR